MEMGNSYGVSVARILVSRKYRAQVLYAGTQPPSPFHAEPTVVKIDASFAQCMKIYNLNQISHFTTN